MLRLALVYGMASAEVLNESIEVDHLINRLNRVEMDEKPLQRIAVYR